MYFLGLLGSKVKWLFASFVKLWLYLSTKAFPESGVMALSLSDMS